METGIAPLQRGSGRGTSPSPLPDLGLRGLPGGGVSPRVGNEGAFQKRMSGWQSRTPCPAAAGRAAMAGRLQSPDSQREEAARAVGGREDGAEVTCPRSG